MGEEILAKSWHLFELAAFVVSFREARDICNKGRLGSKHKHCKVSYLVQRDHEIIVLTIYGDYMKPYCSLKGQQ